MEKIEEKIIETLKELRSLLKEGNNCNGAGVIFPKYSGEDGKTRFSEQECRFLFVQKIANDYAYSVETPTEHKYRFSEGTSEISSKLRDLLPCITIHGDEEFDEKRYGQSANIDLCIHGNRTTRIHAIEFKAHNVDEKELTKDLLKLSFEGAEGCTNFFIHVFETHDEATVKRVCEKYDAAFRHICEMKKNPRIGIQKSGKVVIFIGIQDGYMRVDFNKEMDEIDEKFFDKNKIEKF